MDVEDDDRLRGEIAELLRTGPETEVFPRADTSEMVNDLVTRLGEVGELAGKVVFAGLADHPVEHNGVEQACESCMYYAVHRRFCELPELHAPVEPRWSCRLWRI